mgnify:CR=1 FL=1
MLITFGAKYLGKDTSECPSGFLIWIVESMDSANWSLIQASKQELSARLKLDWEPPPDELKDMQASLALAHSRIVTLEKIIALHRHAAITAEKYIRSPELLEHDLAFIREC